MVVLQVVDVYFPKHPVTNQRQAFCFVTFSTRKVTASIILLPLSKFYLYSPVCFHHYPLFEPLRLHRQEQPQPSASVYQSSRAKQSPGCLQAANVAVSQSNRKINGQLVSSIAATADRPMHHRAGRLAAPTPSTPEAINLQPPLCHAYAKPALEPDHLSLAALQQALAGHNVWRGQANFAPFTQPAPVGKLCQLVLHF